MTNRTTISRPVKRPKPPSVYTSVQTKKMANREQGSQDPNRLSEPPRASASDLRRERARLAQQRSRARTRAELQTLQAQVQSLSTAIDQMTKIFLDFTNEVLAHAGNTGNEQDVRHVKDYMERFLAIAHNVSDTDETPSSGIPSMQISDDMLTDPSSDAADSGPESHFPIYSSSLPDSITSYPQQSPAVWPDVFQSMTDTMTASSSSARYSPRLNYGLLLPAPDMETPVDFRQIARPISFSQKLYWHCLRFGYTIIVSNGPAEAALASNIFYYGLRHDPREVIATRLRRALSRMPERVPMYMSPPSISELPPIPGHQVSVRGNQVIPPHPSDVNDEIEWDNLKRSHEKIVESMYLEGEDVNEYLDSKGVQSRLLHTWGIDATAESAQEDLGTYSFVSEQEDEGERPGSRAAVTPSASFAGQPRLTSSTESQFSARPSAQVEALRRSETLPFQNVPAPIRHMWTAEAMANLWSSIIMKLCIEARCLGKRPGFPVRAVDEVARSLLLVGSA